MIVTKLEVKAGIPPQYEIKKTEKELILELTAQFMTCNLEDFDTSLKWAMNFVKSAKKEKLL